MFENARLQPTVSAERRSAFPGIGFSTNVLNHPDNELIDPAQVIEAIRTLGQSFRCIELELSDEAEEATLRIGPDEHKRLVDGIREVTEDQRLTVSLHATWFGQNTNLADREQCVRANSLVLLKQNIDFAKAIGAQTVTCHPGYHQNQDRASIVNSLYASLTDAVDYARSKDITLCLENMGDDRPSYVVLDVEEQKKICDRSGIRIAMDLIHLRSLYDEEADFKTALEELAPYVGNAHIADMKGRKHNHLPIGDGDFALTESLEILAKHGFRGAAIVEEWVRSRPFNVYLDRAKSYRALIEGPDRTRAQ